MKKHDGRWMDIVRSLQLESFILTKLTKPLVRVNLVGPQVSFRNGAENNKLHFQNPEIIFYKVITCLVHFYSYCPVFIITSHLLFIKAHFLVNPNAYLLGKFAAQRGGE